MDVVEGETVEESVADGEEVKDNVAESEAVQESSGVPRGMGLRVLEHPHQLPLERCFRTAQ